MKEKLRHFMADRYGTDGLGQFLSKVSLVLMIFGLFGSRTFFWLAAVLLGICYFRILSRNREKRVQENYAYYAWRGRVSAWFAGRKQKMADRKNYRYFSCPSCRQQVRVPKGRGLIDITCPKCHNEFRKKS